MSLLIAFLIIWTIAPGPVVALTLNHARQFGAKAGIAVAAGATLTTSLILLAAIAIHFFGITIVDTGKTTLTQLLGGTLIILLGMQAGYKAYMSVGQSTNSQPIAKQHKRSFMQGMMILTASIPQSVIFYAILIPQTIGGDNILPIVAGLGAAKVALTLIWHTSVAVVADRAQSWLNNPRLSQRFDFATALFMVAFGINIIL